MKLKILAALLTAAALPVLAQATTAPAESRQARVEVADPGTATAAPKKATKAKSSKSTKTAKKSSKKKARAKPQTAG